jgi:arsenate reductase
MCATVVIWHNPRCRKSREVLELLRSRGVEPDIREYLKQPPTVEELAEVLARLGRTPAEIVRRKETEFKDLGLAEADADTLLRAMSEHPKLIERPIVLRGDRAALGRPPEAALEVV